MSSYITERLQQENPDLLNEVVNDLKILHGTRLQERILQWKNHIQEMLKSCKECSLSIDNPEHVKRLLSPKEQLKFLIRHLSTLEIIKVFSSIDENHPMLETYDKKYLEETMSDDISEIGKKAILAGYIQNGTLNTNTLKENISNALSCLDYSINDQKNVKSIHYESLHNKYLQEISYYYTRGLEILGDIEYGDKKGNNTHALQLYKTALNVLGNSIAQNDHVHKIQLLFRIADIAYQLGNIEESGTLYTDIIAYCNAGMIEGKTTLYEKIKGNYITNMRYIQEEENTYELFIESAILANILYAQTLLEAKDEAISKLISYVLDKSYNVIYKKGMIQSNKKSSHYLSNLRRFTFARYNVVIGEDEIANKEINLIETKDLDPYIIEAIQLLSLGNDITLRKDIQQTLKIVHNAKKNVIEVRPL